MNSNLFRKTLSVVLVASLGSFLITGCAKKPKVSTPKRVVVPKKQAVVELSPAELYLSSDNIAKEDTTSVVEEVYDMEVNLDNTMYPSAYIVLNNKGEKALKISNIKLLNNEKNLFTLKSECSKSINPDGSCKLKVSFNGKKSGRYTADVEVQTNSNGRYVNRLGKIHVIANAENVRTGVINPIVIKKENKVKKPMTKLFFTSGSLVQYAEIKNNGLEDIMLNGFELVGADKKNFSYSQECSKILKVGKSCELKITYKKKADTMALSYLIVKSNGVLFPSDTIRLKGTPTVTRKAPTTLQLAGKDEMSIKVLEIKIEKNNEDFLEDFSAIKPVYYFRTMYQNNIDTKFKEYYEELIAYYFTKNGYKVTRNANKADKILNIYPTFVIRSNESGDIRVDSSIRAFVITKSKTKDLKEGIAFQMSVVASNFSDSYLAYSKVSNEINSFMFNLLGLEDK